jgi:hypothetical protein
VAYVYDSEGHRVQESVNSTITKFVWDEFSQYGDVLLEQNSTNITQTRYTYGMGRILAQTKSGNTQFLLPDAQGSTRLLINNSASTQQKTPHPPAPCSHNKLGRRGVRTLSIA